MKNRDRARHLNIEKCEKKKWYQNNVTFRIWKIVLKDENSTEKISIQYRDKSKVASNEGYINFQLNYFAYWRWSGVLKC